MLERKITSADIRRNVVFNGGAVGMITHYDTSDPTNVTVRVAFIDTSGDSDWVWLNDEGVHSLGADSHMTIDSFIGPVDSSGEYGAKGIERVRILIEVDLADLAKFAGEVPVLDITPVRKPNVT